MTWYRMDPLPQSKEHYYTQFTPQMEDLLRLILRHHKRRFLWVVTPVQEAEVIAQVQLLGRAEIIPTLHVEEWLRMWLKQ